MPGIASVNGVISGLKTDEIITKLMELERMPITRLQSQKALLDAKYKAWQEANTRILALKTKADSLAYSVGFMTKSCSSSDETVVRGTASTGAVAGAYYITINAMARANQQKSAGFTDTTNTTVGTGDLDITVGGTTTTITVDSSNNTLAGLRDAINRSGAGASASIVNDGSATPYRLVITSQTTGLAGDVTIDASGLTGGTALGFTELQAAQDASVTIGEGAGALTITRGSNKITDVIPGVTLNLQSAAPTKTIAITVQADNAAIKQSIKDFVEQYNNLIDFINTQFKYDVSKKTGGALFSDFNLQMIQSDLASKMLGSVADLDQTIVSLVQIGITSSSTDGKLSINEADLDAALSANLDQVTRLFAATGQASNSAVSYVSSTSATKVSGPAGYAVEITTAAKQAVYTVASTQSENLTQDEVLTINGSAIQLTTGMTPDEVLAAINAKSTSARVTASRVGGYLTLTSAQYGSAVTITASSDVTSGGSGVGLEGSGTFVAGVNVAGTINGEAATGSGQILRGNTGNENTDGLSIRVTGTMPGSYGTIMFTKGIASDLSNYLDFVTAPGTGAVKTAQNLIQSTMRDMDDYIAILEERVTAKEDRLIKQFAAMESALSKLQGQGNYLASQIQQLSNKS